MKTSENINNTSDEKEIAKAIFTSLLKQGMITQNEYSKSLSKLQNYEK